KYDFFLVAFGASAHYAYIDFLKKSLNVSIFELLFHSFDHINFNDLYKHDKKDILALVIWFSNYNVNELRKYKIFYIVQNIPFIIITRDPISRLKTMVNHGIYTLNNKLKFQEDCINIVHRKQFPYLREGIVCYKDIPDITATEIFVNHGKYINYNYSQIANICKNRVYCFDALDIHPDNVIESIIKFSIFFNKKIDEQVLIDEENYFKEKKWTDLSMTLPIVITFNKEFEIIVEINHIQQHYHNITHQLFNSDEISKELRICVNNYDYFRKNILNKSSYLNEVKCYLFTLIKEIELVKSNFTKYKVSEYNVLNYLKENRNLCFTLKNILDKELTYIKQYYPNIVASWKYYQEFEKMCEELNQ
ncbi:DUF2972 domain-containing protein, partial [Campylobacter molothri]|uniref:DUF2972 domain-containing protein n=1 Tax=Campylobacter molothri TaxID=1032242 RepID=UPI001D5BBB4F|nr:DUF2972 domain-containing protein [Campylobacter sp. RM9759]